MSFRNDGGLYLSCGINEEHSFAESDWLYVFNGADAANADTDGYKMLSEL